MEKKVLNVTFTKSQTATSKGGHMLFSGETELRADIAAYFVDILGKNCKITIDPEEGQEKLEFDEEDQEELDMGINE